MRVFTQDLRHHVCKGGEVTLCLSRSLFRMCSMYVLSLIVQLDTQALRDLFESDNLLLRSHTQQEAHTPPEPLQPLELRSSLYITN